MLIAVLSSFVLAGSAPWLHRVGRGMTGWILALLPLGLTFYFVRFLDRVAAGEDLVVSYAWVPSLGVRLSFYLDGLSLLFAVLISGVGMLVVVYAGGYLAGHRHLGRFYAFLLMFMGSMLGLVLADNVITLFVFWELTSLSSYLLIGFDHEREAARSAALQALLVTAIGGLALLAGLLLLGEAGGSLELSALLGRGDLVRANDLYLPILALILAGAFTKSAQVPFHFWLPSAMEAPTPVSAYLHSSTMVKAGIYLLARLSPILSGTEAWQVSLTVVGGATMVVGAYLAWQETYFKRILAYSTVSVLGILTLLLGLGATPAIEAAMVVLVAHALYKGALFLVAGAVDHETGQRDAEKLSGLRRAMPVTAMAAGLAALSMAGIPPLLGFVGKEIFFEAAWNAPHFGLLLTGAAAATSILLIAVAGLVGLRPFLGKEAPTPRKPHEAPFSLWLGPAVLSAKGLAFGLWPVLITESFLSPTVAAVLGQPATVHLGLWHGWNPALALSVLSIVGGAGLYAGRHRLRRIAARVHVVSLWGPDRLYTRGVDGLNALARGQTRLIQSGYLRYYLLMIIATLVGLGGYTLISQGMLFGPREPFDVRFYEAALAALILSAALAAVRSRSRLGAVASLGVVGYGVALVYIWFGAPDLAMTQFLVETLTVILFVLVFYHLPSFQDLSTRRARVRDLSMALAAGGLMTALVLVAANVQFYPAISDYFAENSLARAHGRNIVNVILVDFRGLDTLGEITVLALAGVGVHALLKLRLGKG